MAQNKCMECRYWVALPGTATQTAETVALTVLGTDGLPNAAPAASEPQPTPTAGLCHRFPPQPDDGWQGQWVATASLDWCGEWAYDEAIIEDDVRKPF